MKKFLLIPYLLFAIQTYAQDSLAIANTLKANKYTLHISGSNFAGTGADFLIKQAHESQFFLIGERHGTAEIPLFTRILAGELSKIGYNYYAQETGSIFSGYLESLLRANNKTAIWQLYKSYPFASAFFNTKDEFIVAQNFVSTSIKTKVLWGLDQEFAFSIPFLFNRIVSLSATQKSKVIAAKWYKRAIDDLAIAKAANNEKLQPMNKWTAGTIDSIKADFSGEKNKEIQTIITELVKSWEIYEFNYANNYYETNLERVNLMKYHFYQQYQQAVSKGDKLPKILFKFGSMHMTRGRSFIGYYDVGNFVAGLADGNGTKSFHVAIYPKAGKDFQYNLLGNKNDFKLDTLPTAVSQYPKFFIDITDDNNDWTIYDLRSLRKKLYNGEIKQMDNDTRNLVLSYDAIIIFPFFTPSSLMSQEDIK